MSPVHPVVPRARRVDDAVSKAGIAMLLRSTAQAPAARKVRSKAVPPGAIRTAIDCGVLSHPAGRAALAALIPCRRIGGAADVAEAVLWLASDHPDGIDDTPRFVDGGMLSCPAFVGNG